MKQQAAKLEARLYLAAVVILLAGLGSSVYIYLTAGEASESGLVEEFQKSKAYRHELEAYGGKVNVLASDFMQWFASLWHGQTLAFTVACITVAIAGCLWFIAGHFPLDHEAEHREE